MLKIQYIKRYNIDFSSFSIYVYYCLGAVTMLSMETPQHQAIYAPLSQAMTDSDSEEEIHNSTKHHKLQQQLQQQQKEYLQQQQQLDLNPNSNNRRNPPNTLNLQPKSYQQNRRKLQIERQRQLERNLYPNSQKPGGNIAGRLNVEWVWHIFKNKCKN